ncbi:MAG: HEAT repeat domain-containing protein, partial [Desulfovibrionaceae bacterium]
MSILEGFRSKDFLEQITLLNEIAGSKSQEALPELLELFEHPMGDASIDAMVVNALNGVLSANEAAVIQGLGASAPAFRTLCIRVAGEYGFPAAAAPLADMAAAEKDPDALIEILTALARIAAPATLPVFRACLGHEDELIAALSIEMIGRFRDDASLPRLMQVVLDNEAPDRFEQCDVTTWKAVEAMAAIGTDDCLEFLAGSLHHKNPTVRRIITDALVALGERAVPFVSRAFNQGAGADDKILAANVLGFIAHRKGADALVAAHDKGLTTDPNVRYAVYESLGRIGTLKGLICLMDGLQEDDELILMAVVGGLERHVNPGMVQTLKKLLGRGDAQARRLAGAICASRAVNLFSALYPEPALGELLMEAVRRSNDPETVDAFRQRLEAVAPECGDRAKADMACLPQTGATTGRALAADDSRSMLALHRAILTDLGLDPLLAANGEEAYAVV